MENNRIKPLEFNNTITNEVNSFEIKGFTSVQYRSKNNANTHNYNNIQSFVNNISVPKTLEELQYYIYEHGCFNVEDILNEKETVWTAPSWAKIGDIVFFMHAKYVNSRLTALRTELISKQSQYTKSQFDDMMQWIKKGLLLHKQFGGKIFAVAHVSGTPEYYFVNDNEIKLHWSSRIYAEMNEIYLLENPIDISEFNNFIFISRQSGITPVFGSDFDCLKKIIKSKNSIPDYFEKSTAALLPLTKITDDNWFKLSNEYRRSFMLETQFRNFYVNYLLRELSDIKTIYRECRCKKNNIPDSFVDNVILFNKKYLPVEVKLSVPCQANINAQVEKYCQDDCIIIDNKANRIVNKDKIYLNNAYL